MKRLFSSLAVALVATLTLAGCGSNDSDGSGTGGSFNDADVTFAQAMIPHHQQAVQMAKIAAMHATTAEVKALAGRIEAAQGPEIETMSGWLEAWGKEVPSGAMSSMDHGVDLKSSGDMPGMMSDADMAKLKATSGPEFDRLWLTMMIEHHSGAIKMAKTEQSKGENADAKALAGKIEADQTAEVAKMQDLTKP